MLKRRPGREDVDRVFHALADPNRRVIVERLSRGPASVSELAQPLPMSLSAVVQHLKVLQVSGLVRSEKVGRVRAFAAWADPETKARWYTDSDAHLQLDFRVGGRECHSGSAPDGRAYRYEAHFHDVVPAQRIVYTYEMLLKGTKISVSLATVEFTRSGDSGTDMVFTEQGAFLDGRESAAGRAQGMGSLLDTLGAELQSKTPG